jgi:hypothetical protein
MKKIVLTGNTYPVKDQLKELGGKWDPDQKAWLVPENKAAKARALVESCAPSDWGPWHFDGDCSLECPTYAYRIDLVDGILCQNSFQSTCSTVVCEGVARQNR